MNTAPAATWPVLRRYTGAQLRRIAMPLGGIGTGTVSLGGRGDLRDWEVINRPAKGFVPRQAFFALSARPAGGQRVTRLLEGPLDTDLYEGARGSTAPNHSLPRFSDCTFETAYPFGQVVLTDPA
ncbi:MAG TPA: GH116 family glycosyl-hydrolase, partial [Gemmatimonadales bacterium]|nr:GH116 family glycosyl-hydrolase [Gemmatimonadales bacterium]